MSCRFKSFKPGHMARDRETKTNFNPCRKNIPISPANKIKKNYLTLSSILLVVQLIYNFISISKLIKITKVTKFSSWFKISSRVE